MAAGDITIRIASETKAFRQGVEAGIIDPLDDAEKALEELGRNRGPDQLEQAMKDAQDATDKLGDETRRTADAIEREFRESYRKVGDSGKQGLGRVQDGAKELQTEIGSNLGEAVSSFRGDLSDLGQVGQDTLGGLAASIAGTGPAGLVGALALAAGAAGLGLVTAGMEEAKKKQEELNRAAAEWAEAYQESAGKIVSAAHIVGEVNAIATDPERYQQARDNARDWGITVSTAMLAMAGDATALEVVQDSLTSKMQRWGEVVKETSTGSSNSWDRSTMTAEQRTLGDEVARGTEALELQTEAMRLGREQSANAARALHDYALRAGEATNETDDLGNKIIKLPDGKQIVIDANTKTAYEDLDALERRKLAPKRQRVIVDVDDRAWRNWKPQLKEGQIVANVTRGRLLF
ncbi:hypothetical protein ACQ143_02435 [Microbacterium sp. MC2]